MTESNTQSLPIWGRSLDEPEWHSLLTDSEFMAGLINVVEDMISTRKLVGEVLLITNWPKEAHQALLPVLPERLAEAFDLSVFRADGSLPYLDETEGFRQLSGSIALGPAGFDECQLTPYGEPMPLGPYADIEAILRVPLPIRLDRTRARVRVMPVEEDLVLMVGQFRCGQALRLGNGSFRVEKEVDEGRTPVVLADGASQDTAADLLLAVGRQQAINLAPLAR